MNHLREFHPAGDPPWEPVAPEKVLRGQPQTRTWVHYENPAERLSAGEWEASPGCWRIAYSEWEYMVIRVGHCIITGDDGSQIIAGPGDAFILEPGFTGTWEVTSAMRKHWVIRD